MAKQMYTLRDIPKYESIRANASQYPEIEPASTAAPCIGTTGPYPTASRAQTDPEDRSRFAIDFAFDSSCLFPLPDRCLRVCIPRNAYVVRTIIPV